MNIHSPITPGGIPVIDIESLMDDPHRQFAALRAEHPVVCWGEGKYLVLRAADVMAVLADSRVITIPGDQFAAMREIPDGSMKRMISDAFLLDNGASHRTKRGLFARTFAHRVIESKRPDIRRVADRIVAELPRGETFDFVERMAARLPAEMIATILGLPASEIAFFTSRVYNVARSFTPVYPIEDHEAIETAAQDLFDYVQSHITQRLINPQKDFLSSLAADWEVDEPIPFNSLVHQIMLLILAGSDTTRAAFAMLTALLAQHEDQWDAARADASLIPGAVMEGLRYEPSVGSLPRFVSEPMEIGGIELPAGSFLSIQNMSAMRDPALYEEPDRFDITRTDHPRLHLVFGGGVHRCIGEMLARVEMEEGLAALLNAVPRLSVPVRPEMTGIGGIRQITPMPAYIP